MIKSPIGLVLEGGGMRGVFTSGVLDYFLDKKLYFPYVVGVSAGAWNGLSYVSKQRGRSKYGNIDLMQKYKYIGLKQFIKSKSIIDLDLLFGEFTETIMPYDYDTYFSGNQRIEMVTSNCITGKAVYLEEQKDRERLLTICKASGSLPLMSPIVYVDQVPMLDGGVCDSIPILRAMEQGYSKNVVVLTRNKGFRKRGMDVRVPSFIYRKYPEFRKALEMRNELYNDQLALVDRLEAEDKIIVIRPIEPILVTRLEKDTARLSALYDQGYACAAKVMDGLIF